MDFGKNTCYAHLKQCKISHYKMDLVASLIRGLSSSDAMDQLSFSKKDGAVYFKNLLKSCIANAENNHNMSTDSLFVYRVTVGKGKTLKRFMARGRGRSTRIEKRYSRLTIVLKVQDDEYLSKSKKSTSKKSVKLKK